MKVITKEALFEMLREIPAGMTEHERGRQSAIKQIITQCKEINPWKPIDENVIEHKRYLVKFDDNSLEVARLVGGTWLDNDNLDFNYGSDTPTRYCELPENSNE